MRKKLIWLAVLLITVLITYKLGENFATASRQFCKYDLNNALSTHISGELLDFSTQNQELLSQICTFNTQSGSIKSIQVNNYAISTVIVKIENLLSKSIRDFHETSFGMPLGNALGIGIFSGKGPKMTIRTVPLGSIACDTESRFDSAGINQTHFRITLNISCAYEALTPFENVNGALSFCYTLCESIIVGDVPRLFLQS